MRCISLFHLLISLAYFTVSTIVELRFGWRARNTTKLGGGHMKKLIKKLRKVFRKQMILRANRSQLLETRELIISELTLVDLLLQAKENEND